MDEHQSKGDEPTKSIKYLHIAQEKGLGSEYPENISYRNAILKMSNTFERELENDFIQMNTTARSDILV